MPCAFGTKLTCLDEKNLWRVGDSAAIRKRRDVRNTPLAFFFWANFNAREIKKACRIDYNLQGKFSTVGVLGFCVGPISSAKSWFVLGRAEAILDTAKYGVPDGKKT